MILNVKPIVRQVEFNNFKIFKYASVPLSNFHVLIGPNASGKSTFLDSFSIVNTLVSGGVGAVTDQYAEGGLHFLFHKLQGSAFELAFEFIIPKNISDMLGKARKKKWKKPPTIARYEVSIGYNADQEASILSEYLLLGVEGEVDEPKVRQPTLFPKPVPSPDTILIGNKPPKQRTGWYRVFKRAPDNNDVVYFFSEVTGWNIQYKVGAARSALAALPLDPDKFPTAISIQDFFLNSVQHIALISNLMSRPVRPGSPRTFIPDGSNLPRIVELLREEYPKEFDWWLKHVQTILPDVTNIDYKIRQDDRFSYIEVTYSNNLSLPSWSLSDGTLRILALTLLAFMPFKGFYTLEEPENGVHPKALGGIFEALKNVYGSQIIIATHSPILLRLADLEDMIIFGKTSDGVGDIVRGQQHPTLLNWRKSVGIDTLFASGVLG